MGKKVIGIDLGSTLSELAVIEAGKPVVVANEDGSYTTPSVIGLKDGSPKVGSAAKRQMVVSPKETIYLVKRFMGGTYDECKDAIDHVTYDVVNENGRPRIKVNDRNYSPEELSSMILTKLKKVAEDYLGQEVTDAVITVPAFFSDAAKSATKQAGELAGLNVLRIISEPTAALLASNIDKQKGGKYLVVDYGGSTLDFSVADVSDGVVEILSSYGDVYCGGSDIDKAVAKYIVDIFKDDNGIDLNNDAMAMSRIYEAAEKAKIELSSSASTDVNLPYITAKDGSPLHLNVSITKAKFEQIISNEVNKVINCGKIALERAKLSANDLDGILLVGGSCRIPLVQDELVKAFGDKLIKSANLDLAVAEGAAIQANAIANGDSDILLLDVCPISIGIETEGGVMTKLIDANTTIPCSKEQTFSTAADFQTTVSIHVLQGERPLVKDNKSIGMFNLDGIIPAKRGVPQITVKFDVNADGILTVSATDKGTGKEQHITIQNSNTLTQDEIDRIKRDAETYAEEDKKTRERIEKINKLDSTVYQVEKVIEDFKDKPYILSENEKNELNSKVEQLKSLRDGDLSGIDPIIKDIEGKLMMIGSKAYGQNNPNASMFGMGNPFGGNPMDFADIFGGANKGTTGNTTTEQPNNAEAADFEEVH